MMRVFALGFFCLALIASTGCGTAPEQVLTPEEAKAIAKEAYLYGFPMVMNYKTMYNYVIDTENPEYKGPFNQVACEARLFTPEDRAIVTPNSQGCGWRSFLRDRAVHRDPLC